jgi:hypothetical protein
MGPNLFSGGYLYDPALHVPLEHWGGYCLAGGLNFQNA